MQAELAARPLFDAPQDGERRFVLQSLDDGRTLFSTEGLALPGALAEAPPGEFGTLDIDGETFFAVSRRTSAGAASADDPRWVMHVLVESSLPFAGFRHARFKLLVAGFLLLILSGLVGRWVARGLGKPIDTLVQGVEELAEGNAEAPLPLGRRDEIGTMARSFARMRDAVAAKHAELLQRTEVSEQAARLKGEFLANMSHEVRTPINGVMGMTELLLGTELNESQERHAKTIYRSGQSLLHVINDILDFSKIEAGKLQLDDSGFDLRETVEDVVELLAENAHRKGLELTLDLDPASHVAYRGDTHRLRQVLTNLIGNAVKFTERGQVSLDVSVTDAGDGSDEALLRFAVSDTGIGISESARAAVFDSFVQADGSTTRQYGGTGLGLAISASLVELMGGEIGVESVLGEGSTFWFTARVGVLSSEVEDGWQDKGALGGRRVLVVDDNQTNRQIVAGQLDYWGAVHEAVDGGRAAIAALREAAAASRAFELVILDMNMPGMDGLQTAEAVRDDPTIPATAIALLSSMCDQIDVAHAGRLGIGVTLTKPVRQPELYKSLSELLGRRTGHGDERRAERAVIDPAARAVRLSGRVLLAEDHPVNQQMMSEMLRLTGLEVVCADDGRQAIDALDAGAFDVVLMDCQMPVLDGFASTREIREREAASDASTRQTIVALTANALAGDREACLEAGMDDYLSKPVSRAELVRCLRLWLPADAERPADDANTPADAPSAEGAPDAEPTPESTHGPVLQPESEPEPEPASDAKPDPKVELKHDSRPDAKHDSKSQTPLETAPETMSDTAPDTAADPLDPTVFGAVLEMTEQAPEGFLEQLVGQYLSSMHEDLDAIARAVATDDVEAIRSLAHRLKSSSANFGATRLAAPCQEMENAAREGDASRAPELLERMRGEAGDVERALRSYLPPKAA